MYLHKLCSRGCKFLNIDFTCPPPPPRSLFSCKNVYGRNVMSAEMLGGVSNRSRSGDLSRNVCVVNGQMIKASNKNEYPLPAPALPLHVYSFLHRCHHTSSLEMVCPIGRVTRAVHPARSSEQRPNHTRADSRKSRTQQMAEQRQSREGAKQSRAGHSRGAQHRNDKERHGTAHQRQGTTEKCRAEQTKKQKKSRAKADIRSDDRKREQTRKLAY